ncbi:HTH_XRE domain containing protein [uncultured Caudovirales phage]|uniref:HTH_XRE domain containing protein n=1 Tax=uncultured Caudovirales phage TaxID=2100421 RepID=A0A6J5KUY8_9CAUD|nr:HTH_XRE domain containing protein [uncultured Caudovirales phage]
MVTKNTDLKWIRDGLAQRNYIAKDLAKAFEISESSISRWLNGQESTDLPLSRAVTLAQMLGITLDEVAKGLGVMGKRVAPPITAAESTRAPRPQPNSMNLVMIEGGNVRLSLVQDTTPMKAMEVMKVLAIS